MNLKDLISDSNRINEQSFAGFIALGLAAIITLADVATGCFSKELVVKEFIFISLLTYSAAAFGISGYKTINHKNNGEGTQE